MPNMREAMLERDPGRRDFRLLEFGVAQAGAAGAREAATGCLFYPSQYEGEEQSPHVVYTGATPRQQALPAVEYLLDQGRRSFILVGSDYVYPRTTNAILKNYLASRGIAPGRDHGNLCAYGERIWRETIERMAPVRTARRCGDRLDHLRQFQCAFLPRICAAGIVARASCR